MKIQRIIYWVATALFSLLYLFSVYNYLFNHEAIKGAFESLGYPVYLIYPLATAKILGLVVILSNKGGSLKEWAYAGFVFNTILAFFAHYMVSDGQQMGAALALILILTSYFLGKKVRP
ncbi:DoxX family protein [Leptobacterium flavescens]|uniref:DoxX family protein n=1 Tax=Leptobacterium flavescens TaxID=472055 RepID=A0A6P0UM11_9FLAO|nr:DoxX family protein [Leptobacterium flavescens]NER14275.1 DoxX family protein [Leptobacterium flavescens]